VELEVEKIEIRLADISLDLREIVLLHLQAFPGFFMTDMGAAFVREYYKAVLEFSENLSFVAIQNNRILGFAVGFGNPEGFYSFYRNRRVRLIPIVLRSLLQNPHLLGRILRNFKRVSSIKGSDSEVELSSIGVNPACAGIGIGQSLIKAFLEKARQRGYRSVYLTTDAEVNERVNVFYLKQGFTLEKTSYSGSRKMNEYRLFIEGLQ